MRLKLALKASETIHALDGDSCSFPYAVRTSNNIQWVISKAHKTIVEDASKGEVIIMKFTGEVIIMKFTPNEIAITVRIAPKKNLLWNCPLRFIIHIIGRRDWKPGE